MRDRYGALLKGLLRCSCCDCSMMHTYSVKPGGKRYRYYVCTAAQKRGWDTCASKSVPAGEMEQFVVEQVRAAGRDPAVLAATLRQVAQQQQKAASDLAAERKALERELARHHLALRKLAAAPDADRLADLNELVQRAERKLLALRERQQAVDAERVDPEHVRSALAAFGPVWGQMAPREQARSSNCSCSGWTTTGPRGRCRSRSGRRGSGP